MILQKPLIYQKEDPDQQSSDDQFHFVSCKKHIRNWTAFFIKGPAFASSVWNSKMSINYK